MRVLSFFEILNAPGVVEGGGRGGGLRLLLALYSEGGGGRRPGFLDGRSVPLCFSFTLTGFFFLLCNWGGADIVFFGSWGFFTGLLLNAFWGKRGGGWKVVVCLSFIAYLLDGLALLLFFFSLCIVVLIKGIDTCSGRERVCDGDERKDECF